MSERLVEVVRASARVSAVRAAVRGFIQRHLPNEGQHLFALTLVVGVVCGVVAVAFHLAIQGAERLLIEQALDAQGSSWIVWTIVTPTLGGLLAGAALTFIVPGARGSGIPQVKQAFAVEGGRVRFRDAVGKFIIGALQIGSGASLGREGPTVQICAGATSLLARATSLPPRNMRRLTPVGVAAGIAAAFNAPIAAVTFTIEEIVGTLDHAILSGVVVAAALAAVIERSILGVHPVIEVDRAYGLDHASSLAFYAVLGLAAAILSVAFTDGLLGLRGWFRRFTLVPSWAHPAVGGLITGVLAVVALQFLGATGVSGGGYETLGHALAGQLGLRVLLALCFVKVVATVFSYSSGGAGGIFAPALFIGAMLGGAVGHLDVLVLGHESSQLGAFALVGMGAAFAGIVRAPITSVLIIFEMTGSYGLVLPLMLANVTSYVIARRLRPTPIYEALLDQDGIVLPRATAPTHVLEQLRVADAMTSDVVTIRVGQSVDEARALVSKSTFSALPVVDAAAAVLGVAPVARVRAADLPPDAPVTTVMAPGHVIRSDVPLLRAIVRMNELGVRQLLVVDPETESRLSGVLAMSDIVRAHARAVARADTRGGRTQPGLCLPALRTGQLIRAAFEVSPAAKLAQLDHRLVGDEVKAFVVRDGAQGFGVVLPEHLDEFGRDPELEKILVAADLARRASSVQEGVELAALVETMHEEGTEAAVVLDTDTKEPVGVITKHALALAFLDWYAELPSKPFSSSVPIARPA